MKDLGAPETRGRRPGMLVLAIGLAIGAGVLASVLKPPAGPTQTASGGIAVPVSSETPTPDPDHRAKLLEQLVAASRSEPRPSTLPAYEALALPCRRGMPACAPVLARLTDDDVPLALLAAFAGELPRGSADEVDTLLLPLLRSGDEERQRVAIDLYRKRKRAKVATDTGCRCGFGVAPTPLAGEAWIFADAPRGGLAWEPEEIEGGWRLGVRRDDSGVGRLVQRIEVGDALRVEAAEGGAVITLGGEEGSDGDP